MSDRTVYIHAAAIAAIVGYGVYQGYRAITKSDGCCGNPSACSGNKKCGKSMVNLSLQKDQNKVVDTVTTDDIGDKKVFCRCWRSAKFPYCDGAHNKHNEETGDNIGPLIIKRSD